MYENSTLYSHFCSFSPANVTLGLQKHFWEHGIYRPSRISTPAPVRATRYNMKFVLKTELKVRNRRPDMAKINNWKEKSTKYLNKGLRYVNKIDAMDQRGNDRTKPISFNMEKVCVILSLASNLCKRLLFQRCPLWYIVIHLFYR